MKDRQSRKNRNARLPKIWLMTDARFGTDLLPAVRRMPFGSGIIFRHHHLAQPERRKLFASVRHICAQRGHMLILADTEQIALAWRAGGFHQRSGQRRSSTMRSAPVHNRAELRDALRNKADLLFISPLFATASHPGKRPLGKLAFAQLAKQRGGATVIALGGMDRRRGMTIKPALAHGWAAIDAFRKAQN